jgi:hypothetical protein
MGKLVEQSTSEASSRAPRSIGKRQRLEAPRDQEGPSARIIALRDPERRDQTAKLKIAGDVRAT